MEYEVNDRVVIKGRASASGTVVEVEDEFIFVEWDDPTVRSRFPRVWLSEGLVNITPTK